MRDGRIRSINKAEEPLGEDCGDEISPEPYWFVSYSNRKLFIARRVTTPQSSIQTNMGEPFLREQRLARGPFARDSTGHAPRSS